MYETTTWDGRDATEWVDHSSHGDDASCHTEPPTCGCPDVLHEPPVGTVVKVRAWTLRENVRHTVANIRAMRAMGHTSLENLYVGDLRALLASRGCGK